MHEGGCGPALARAQAELLKLQPPCFAKQVSAGLGQDGRWLTAVYSPYGVAECLKISKAVLKLGERRRRGPSAVPTAGAGLLPLPLCSDGSLKPSEDQVRADHRLFSSVGRLQGILFYRMSFLLPVVQCHPYPHCLFALALIASLSKVPWMCFAVPGELCPRQGLVPWLLSEPSWWCGGRCWYLWKMPWSLGSISRTEHPGCWWCLSLEATAGGYRGSFGCRGGRRQDSGCAALGLPLALAPKETTGPCFSARLT